MSMKPVEQKNSDLRYRVGHLEEALHVVDSCACGICADCARITKQALLAKQSDYRR